MTALMAAVSYGQIGATKFLLLRVSNIGYLNRDVRNALHLAVRHEHKHTELVDLLIPHTSGVIQADRNGDTPLRTAALYRSPKIVAKLLDRLQDPSYQHCAFSNSRVQYDRHNRTQAEYAAATTLQTAVQGGKLSTVKMLVQRPDVMKWGVADVLLGHALPHHDEVLVELVNAGLDLTPPVQGMLTPLMITAQTNCAKSVAAMLRQGADLHYECSRGGSALSFAMTGNRPSAVQAGAD
ncbi:ankyrin repeat-containing domain protein [Aspergillus multicolor]|uniref:ankyrin repeat domain-containing protein n=1 Tax=Aspergillus multicolor TaxID=41759 RepID=UPI003CCD0789